MSRRSESWFTDIWYRRRRAPLWLLPASALFILLSGLRRLLYAAGLLRVQRLDVPVLVVGNIAVGGTGKTPFTLYLVRTLQALGRRPGVILRGYGGTAATAGRVTADSDPVLCGDEAVLLARRAGCPVFIGRDRVAAARLLREHEAVDCIVSDDGLQHYRLGRDLEIAVVDGSRGLGNGARLPAGPLREPPGRLRTVDLLVVNGDGYRHEAALRMRLQPDDLVALDGSRSTGLAGFRGRRVHAVAGIGNPQRFFDTLHAAGIGVIPHPLPDHAVFEAGTLEFGDTLPVIMTEKDAVKCRHLARPDYWYLAVNAEFAPDDARRIRERLQRLFAGRR